MLRALCDGCVSLDGMSSAGLPVCNQAVTLVLEMLARLGNARAAFDVIQQVSRARTSRWLVVLL